MDFGDFEMRSYQELQDDPAFQAWCQDAEHNTCPNGEKYARKELTAPERILTTTLPILGGDRPTVSVKTAAPVPKGMIFACMEALRGVSVSAPVKMGQTLVENLANTGVSLVATRAVEEK